MMKNQENYRQPDVSCIRLETEGDGLLAGSGKYGVNVDGKNEIPSGDANEGFLPDDIDAKDNSQFGENDIWADDWKE